MLAIAVNLSQIIGRRTHTERETARERKRERDRERKRERDRERERERERETAQRGSMFSPQHKIATSTNAYLHICRRPIEPPAQRPPPPPPPVCARCTHSRWADFALHCSRVRLIWFLLRRLCVWRGDCCRTFTHPFSAPPAPPGLVLVPGPIPHAACFCYSSFFRS